MPRTAAVFFDVDFTLVHPGPRFQAEGYRASCVRHGLTVDPARFDAAVAGASVVLDEAGDVYDPELFVAYTRRIVELMGGAGPAVDAVAREIFADWNGHHHFSLYDDVPAALEGLRRRGIRIGLISNSQRCLMSFQSHFALTDFVAVAITSSDHGYMKPHPSIFRAALERMQVAAADAVMVGDSLLHDVRGAERAGMRGILLARGGAPAVVDVPVIRTLDELPHAL